MRHTVVVMLDAQEATAEDVQDMAEARGVADAAFHIAGFHVLDQANQGMLVGLVVAVEALEAFDALVVGADVDAGGDVGFQRFEVGG